MSGMATAGVETVGTLTLGTIEPDEPMLAAAEFVGAPSGGVVVTMGCA